MKKYIILVIVSLFFSYNLYSQKVDLVFISNLSSVVNESSGLLLLGDKLWTHNDSGGEAKLYQIDTITGEVLIEKLILNSENFDWEDVTNDEEYVYVADIGNNKGMRDTLKIYRLSISELINDDIGELESAIISFSYHPDIVSADPQENRNTNLDCEAIISLTDSLYLFSKNWINKKTYLFSLPKQIGHYVLEPLDSLNVDCLITGADYCPMTNSVCLIGYTDNIQMQAIFILLSNFINNDFLKGDFTRYVLPKSYLQTEAIVFKEKLKFWITNESFLSQTQALWQINILTNEESISDTDLEGISIYPNPTNDILMVECSSEEEIRYKLVDCLGSEVLKSKAMPANGILSIDVSTLNSGTYIIELRNSKLLHRRKIVKSDSK